jgi:hypothetical protein
MMDCPVIGRTRVSRDRGRECKPNGYRQDERTSHRFLLIPFPRAHAPVRKSPPSIKRRLAVNGAKGLKEIEPVWMRFVFLSRVTWNADREVILPSAPVAADGRVGANSPRP